MAAELTYARRTFVEENGEQIPLEQEKQENAELLSYLRRIRKA